jgi:stage III sporulation protein SpoIIIAA
LLLGPPGSGKATLLRALAGKLDKDLKVFGKVTLQWPRDERVCAAKDRGLHQPARSTHWGDDREGDLSLLGAVPRCWYQIW